MQDGRLKIGVVAPGGRIETSVADNVKRLALDIYQDRCPELVFHPQCFLSSGHFAGDDYARAEAFLDFANDDSFDALWFARGGYGSCRLVETIRSGVTEAAGKKTYLGYSDAGMLLAALYNDGIGHVAHGPMPVEITRENGAVAITRALAFLVDGAPETVEPTVLSNVPTAAFNITILSHLLGTPFEPRVAGHVLMLEEVSEHMYRIDRALFHITSNPGMRMVEGIMLGRCSDIPENDPDFGQSEEDIARHWCQAAGIPYLGRADIGHDIDNKIVPFGWWPIYW